MILSDERFLNHAIKVTSNSLKSGMGVRSGATATNGDASDGDGQVAAAAATAASATNETEIECCTKHCDLEQALNIVKRSIREGFLNLDSAIRASPEVSKGDISGSTAVCCLISPTHYYFANCGDSRAVLSSKGKSIFATQDHKPVNPEEKERILRAGGNVMIQRVNGSLAVSRALGDYQYKQVCGSVSSCVDLLN